MTNPNPAFITDEMWRMWTDRPNPAWKLGGIYANKKGYHNTVNVNLKNWPGTYSVRLKLDTEGVRTKARGIDYTMSDSEMRAVTRRLNLSALDPKDDRLAAVREFYGTLDNEEVYGRIKSNLKGPWIESTSDPSHLWHIHMSIFAEFVNNWKMLEPILSVISGQTLEEWNVSREMFLPKLGDSGDPVSYWQRVFNKAIHAFDNVDKPVKILTADVDGDYGPQFAAALTSYYKAYGGTGDYKGAAITGWVAFKLHEDMMKVTSPPPVEAPLPFPVETVKEIINQWLSDHLPDDLVISGTINGKVEL